MRGREITRNKTFTLSLAIKRSDRPMVFERLSTTKKANAAQQGKVGHSKPPTKHTTITKTNNPTSLPPKNSNTTTATEDANKPSKSNPEEKKETYVISPLMYKNLTNSEIVGCPRDSCQRVLWNNFNHC